MNKKQITLGESVVDFFMELRKNLNMTIKDFAKVFRIKPSAVRKWERRKEIRGKLVFYLAPALGMIDELKKGYQMNYETLFEITKGGEQPFIRGR